MRIRTITGILPVSHLVILANDLILELPILLHLLLVCEFILLIVTLILELYNLILKLLDLLY